MAYAEKILKFWVAEYRANSKEEMISISNVRKNHNTLLKMREDIRSYDS